MSYYREPDSQINDKVKGVATGVHTSHLTAKKDFIALQKEIGKLTLIKLLMFQLVWIY